MRSSGIVEVTERFTAGSEGASLNLTAPRFAWTGDGEPYPDRQFPELQITIGGTPAALEDVAHAFASGREITDLLSKAAVDPYAVAESPPIVRPASDHLQALVAAKAVMKDGGEYLGKWSVERHVSVKLAGSSQVKLTYKARPAFELLTRKQLVASPVGVLRRYCLSQRELNEALEAVLRRS